MSKTKCHMIGLLDIKGIEQIRRVYDPDGLSPTLTTSGGGYREVKIFDFKRFRVRKLTPTEYGRLQAFPMGRWKQVVSDSQAYKQFGNAVTVSLFQEIAENIKEAIVNSENEREELNMESMENAMNAPVEAETEETEVEAVEENQETEEQTEAVEETANIEPELLAEHLTSDLFEMTYIPGINFDIIKEALINKLYNYVGKVIGREEKDTRDWKAAVDALETELNKYASMGPVGIYGIKALTPLKERIDTGERTPELFNEIVTTTRS